MTTLDNEKRKIGFNAFDVAIVLVIIALIVTAAVRSGIADKMTFSPSTFSVKLVCNDSCFDLGTEINGKAVYTDDGEKFGEVTNVRVETVNGEFVCYEIDVNCSLVKKNGRYVNLAGDTLVKGVEVTLHSQTATFIAGIDSVS